MKNINQSKKSPTFWEIITIVSLFTFSCLVHATEVQKNQVFLHEIKFGVLKHDVDGFISHTGREEAIDINIEAVFSVFRPLLAGEIHPAVGASINTHGGTSKIYFDAIWQLDLNEHYFTNLGLGIAAHDGNNNRIENNKKAMGSRLLLHFPIEVGYRLNSRLALSIYIDHISNGYTNSENPGLDTLGGRVSYRF